MPSATPGSIACELEEDTMQKKRLRRSTKDSDEAVGSAAMQQEYKPILETLELDDDEMLTDEHRDEGQRQDGAYLNSTTMELGGGSETTEQQGETSSLYAQSQFTTNTAGRGYHRPFDDGATVNSNRSIAPMDVEYFWENGRRYCGSYFMPNDKMEQTRLLLVHEVFKSAFDGEPTTAPLENPTAILDVGAGTGDWAMDMADRYPDCEVTGFDIADMFPRFVAPNLFWEIDNAELEWLRPPDSYDLVHFRNMDGAFSNWPFVYSQAFKVCKPGGYVELLDYDDLWSSGNYFLYMMPDSLVNEVAQDWKQAAFESGYPIGALHLCPELLRDAGFEDVTLTVREIPVSPKEMSTGHLFLKTLIEGLEAHCLRLLTKYKGYTAEQVRAAIQIHSQEFKDVALDREKAKGFAVKILVLMGRKPLEPRANGHDVLDLSTKPVFQEYEPHCSQLEIDTDYNSGEPTPTHETSFHHMDLEMGQRSGHNNSGATEGTEENAVPR